MTTTQTLPPRDEREYVLGTHDDELQRLGFQHQMWRAQAYALWERAGFAPGQTLLDLGCGPGFTTLDLAALAGPVGRVIGVDVSERFIANVHAQCRDRRIENVTARVGDIHELDLPPASLDGAYTRWVLCFVADPQRAIDRVARALRPGATFAVQDYYNYRALALCPRSDIFDRVVAAVAESWSMHGGDCDVGRRVPGMMRRAGLRVREITPILRIARPTDSLWQWPATFFRIYVPTLVQMGMLTADDQRAFETEWQARSNDPDSFLTTPPVLDIIGVK